MKGIRVVAAPGDWALRGDAKYVEHLCTTPVGEEKRLPQVIGFTEAKDFRLEQALRDRGLHKDWVALQVTKDKAHMGCAFAVSRQLHIYDWGQTLGAAPYIGGRRIKMLARYQTHVRLGYHGLSYFLDGIHDPPKRFGALQPRYDNHTKGVIAGHPHAVVLGDFNQWFRKLANTLELKAAVGSGIIGILHRTGVSGLHAHDSQIDHWGIRNKVADHPALYTTLLPTRVWRERS